jgi:hypothetical protein
MGIGFMPTLYVFPFLRTRGFFLGPGTKGEPAKDGWHPGALRQHVPLEKRFVERPLLARSGRSVTATPESTECKTIFAKRWPWGAFCALAQEQAGHKLPRQKLEPCHRYTVFVRRVQASREERVLPLASISHFDPERSFSANSTLAA